jgi:maltose alpha-D-glucosyltransferase/alpha-amylase
MLVDMAAHMLAPARTKLTTAEALTGDVRHVASSLRKPDGYFAALRDADGMVRIPTADGRISNGMAADPLWHQGKTPVYQIYTRTFADGRGTGTGNFSGMIDKLDHVEYMRQKAIWISPHHPYGGKDQGYDITDYLKVNPKFGTMREFETLVDKAHDRGIRVVTEMVMNHTSDQHKWFTADLDAAHRIVKSKGREAAQEWAMAQGKQVHGEDSPMYVWDFTRTKEQGPPKRWNDVRVIFNDTEPSNWAWRDFDPKDPTAGGGWYWHRFFTEQPDLNWYNPRVPDEMKKVVSFWMDKGVDCIRFDAIPYLFQGTREAHGNTYHGENMIGTHNAIKDFRSFLDRNYGDRVILGEANMDAAATREYFGAGDECNALFDFPTMPQTYLALLKRNKHSILKAFQTAQGIPGNASWWRFLANHDERTLEKIHPRLREAIWKIFEKGSARLGITADPEARINLGLRHRLADMVGHDDDPVMKQKAIESLFSILYTQSGTPIMYNGDEIGQQAIRGKGLFDRERVRGAIQWTAGRHFGFSSAKKVTEPIADAGEGAHMVNVAAQKADPNSQMNRVRNMLLAREQSSALQSNAPEVEVSTSAKELLAFQRSTENERVISMVNLSPERVRSTMDVEVPKGWRVERLHGSDDFDVSKGIPREVEMRPYEYQWLRLVRDDA